MPFSPSDFATIADGLETVTLLRRGSLCGTPGTPIAHALRRAMSVREAAASDGRYTANDLVWHLPAAELVEPPRLGDVIRDATGRRWTVLEAARVALGSRWRCAARNLAAIYGLDDTISLLQAVYAKGQGGAAEATWRAWKTGIRARIQPVASQPGIEHQSRVTPARCRILVEEDLDLDHTHRILGPDGTVYKILAVAAAARIGELQTIEVEATPWP